MLCMLALLLAACGPNAAEKELARQIRSDRSLQQVDSMARAVIRQGLTAGSGYSQVWIRDLNTFIEVACEEMEPAVLREAILLFFALQQPNGEMIDDYVLKPDFTWEDDSPYYSDAAPDHVAFKNTVETDQESSLIQTVGKYVRATGDRSILDEVVAGRSVRQRMDEMVDYLLRERYDETHGLLFGAMTADWGDVQPYDDFGCDMNEKSFPAIDIYDNAMFLLALDWLAELANDDARREHWAAMHDRVAEQARRHLWDAGSSSRISTSGRARPCPKGSTRTKSTSMAARPSPSRRGCSRLPKSRRSMPGWSKTSVCRGCRASA